MDRTELISLLDVPSEPTTGQVRQARRTLARRLHPDATGSAASSRMAEINAAVDAWIAEIRARRQAGPTGDVTIPSEPPAAPIDAPVPFRVTHAIATVLLVGAVIGVVVLVVGLSVMTLATGALLGAVAGAVYAAVLYRIERG